MHGNFQDRFYVRKQELSGVWEVLIIPPDHYASIETIFSKMKELVDNEKRFTDDVRFSYDTLSRKVTVHLQNNAELFFGDTIEMGVSVAQEVLAGENLKTATKKRVKQALGLPSQNSPQSGAGKKRYKKESTTKKKQFASRQEPENISSVRETRRQIFLLKVKWLLFITNLKSARSQSSIS